MFERIVQFTDNTYGIKRGIMFPEYLDNTPTHFLWWFKYQDINKYCKFNTIEDAKRKYQLSSLRKEKLIEWL